MYIPCVLLLFLTCTCLPDCGSFKDQKDCENAQCKWDGTKKQCD